MGSKILNRMMNIGLAICGVVLASLLITGLVWHKPSVFGYRGFYIVSESMEPAIMTHQLVLGKTINASDVKVGDIVCYKNELKMMIIHRVIDIEEENGSLLFTFKGDNNKTEDLKKVEENQIQYIIVKY